MKSAYDPGPELAGGDALWLHRNENFFVPRSLHAELSGSVLSQVALHAYPDATSRPLREELARLHGVQVENIFVGNGSDEVLAYLFQFLRSRYDTVATLDIGYQVYPLLAERYGFARVELGGDTFKTGEARAPERPCLIAVDSPGSISGSRVRMESLTALAADERSFLIWDNAYGEYVGERVDALGLRANVAVVRTLSKYYGLAGLRVGYCVAEAGLVAALLARKDVFNVSGLSQAIALAALQRQDRFRAAHAQLLEVRSALVRGLEALGFTVRPPSANFVLASPPKQNAVAVQKRLAAAGISVRRFALPGVDAWLRITVPPAEQLERLLRGLSDTHLDPT